MCWWFDGMYENIEQFYSKLLLLFLINIKVILLNNTR